MRFAGEASERTKSLGARKLLKSKISILNHTFRLSQNVPRNVARKRKTRGIESQNNLLEGPKEKELLL